MGLTSVPLTLVGPISVPTRGQLPSVPVSVAAGTLAETRVVDVVHSIRFAIHAIARRAHAHLLRGRKSKIREKHFRSRRQRVPLPSLAHGMHVRVIFRVHPSALAVDHHAVITIVICAGAGARLAIAVTGRSTRECR